MNCMPGDFAIVVRPINSARIGMIVKVNLCALEESLKTGTPTWDVQASGGRFFYAADESLCRLTGAFEAPIGFRDELFDEFWIFSDGGPPRLPRIGTRRQHR